MSINCWFCIWEYVGFVNWRRLAAWHRRALNFGTWRFMTDLANVACGIVLVGRLVSLVILGDFGRSWLILADLGWSCLILADASLRLLLGDREESLCSKIAAMNRSPSTKIDRHSLKIVVKTCPNRLWINPGSSKTRSWACLGVFGAPFMCMFSTHASRTP